MAGQSTRQGKEGAGMRPRRIVVTGPCGYEVAGVMALLSGAGYPVYHAEAETAGAEDLVVVALSACPELGWWKQQMRLHSVRHGGRYRMVAVVPARLERVVSLQGICPVVAGDVPVLSLWSRLSAEVRAWYEGEAPRAMPGTGEMPEQQAWALAALLSGGMKRRKTQYNSSYSGLTRLGFYSSQQYRRYYSGLAAGDREGHRRLPG